MRLHVKGKNVEVSESIRRYAEDKLRKLDRQLHAQAEVELELSVEKNPSIAANQVAEATVRTKGPTLRVTEASSDMKASIDQLTDVISSRSSMTSAIAAGGMRLRSFTSMSTGRADSIGVAV